MKTIDVSAMIVSYNFVIGVLIMLSSGQLAAYAGHLNKSYSAKLTRLTRVSTFTFGACVAFLSASVYIAWHVFRLGL